jgi:EmrB/QacA subfamily drug resistance transporter
LSDPAAARRGSILLIVATAQLMVVLDSTIINVALPSAQASLGFPDSARQWAITSYALAFGGLVLLGGRIGDRFGHKRSFVTGLLGFAVASAVGGSVSDFGLFVGARLLQGMSAALLAPAALSMLAGAFRDPRERGRAFAVYSGVAGCGAAAGMLLGGVLTEYASWRWCFFINLVFAAVAGIGALLALPREVVTVRLRLDLSGSTLAVSGLFLLIYGFSSAETRGWVDPVTLSCLGVSLGLLATFAVVERTVTGPLLPPWMVADALRGSAYIALGVGMLCLFSVFLLLTYYLQSVLVLSPIATGLSFLPLVAAIFVGSSGGNILLLPRFGVRLVVCAGLVLAAAGLVCLSCAVADGHGVGKVPPSLVLLGVGLGLCFGPSVNAATQRIPPGDAGIASAVVNTMQQVGGSIGAALSSTIAAGAAGSYRRAHPGSSLQAAAHGYASAFLVAAGLLVAAAISVLALAAVAARIHPAVGATIPADGVT